MRAWIYDILKVFRSLHLLCYCHTHTIARNLSALLSLPFPCGHHVYMPPKDGPSSIYLLTNLPWGWTISVIPLAAISRISVKSGAQLRMTLNREMGNVHGYMASTCQERVGLMSASYLWRIIYGDSWRFRRRLLVALICTMILTRTKDPISNARLHFPNSGIACLGLTFHTLFCAAT